MLILVPDTGHHVMLLLGRSVQCTPNCAYPWTGCLFKVVRF